MTFYTRATIGTPTPPSTRPKLLDVDWLLCHEVGVDTGPTGRYTSADPAKVLADAQAAASYGIAAGKPWEYTAMVGLDGSVFMQAGEYRAAHCLNWNAESAGIILLRALHTPPTPAMIAGWHAARTYLVGIGVLTANHQVAPHYRFRSTSCPGLAAELPGKAWASPTGEGRLGDLIPALLTAQPKPQPPTSPIPPASPQGDDMQTALFRKNGKAAIWKGDGRSREHVTSQSQVDALTPIYGPVLLLDEAQTLDSIGKVVVGVDPGDI